MEQADGLPDLRHRAAQVDAGEQAQAIGEGGLASVIRWRRGTAQTIDHLAPARVAEPLQGDEAALGAGRLCIKAASEVGQGVGGHGGLPVLGLHEARRGADEDESGDVVGMVAGQMQSQLGTQGPADQQTVPGELRQHGVGPAFKAVPGRGRVAMAGQIDDPHVQAWVQGGSQGRPHCG